MPVSQMSHISRDSCSWASQQTTTPGTEGHCFVQGSESFSTKKTRAAPSLETSLVLDLCREMPPPSETQKAAGYQNQGEIKQSSWALNKKNETVN